MWNATKQNEPFVKEIVGDSNNVFLWHESLDINKKMLISKISVDSILPLQVMHDYVHWHCSTDYCVKVILVDENLCEDCCNFTLKWFLLNSFGEMCFLKKSYKKMQKIQIFKFWNFWERPLYEIWEYVFKQP